MRLSKIFTSVVALLIVSLAVYAAFIYVYTDHMFAPVPLFDNPNPAAPAAAWNKGYTRFVHQVNTPRRAQQKENRFEGFETDVWNEDGNLYAADNKQQLSHPILLSEIFAAVQQPQQKIWWLRFKRPLTGNTLSQILQLAKNYQIPSENLLLEATPGPQADLVKKYNLPLLLPLPAEFTQDTQDPKQRAQLNAQVLQLWQQYQPVAVSASFGKYGYLRAYFPNMPKAIYYSCTVRPSLKKPFMSMHLKQDPSVKIFMTDEYTWINL